MQIEVPSGATRVPGPRWKRRLAFAPAGLARSRERAVPSPGVGTSGYGRLPLRGLLYRVLFAILALMLLAHFADQRLQAEDAPLISSSTVGMPAKVEQLVLPGPEVEARPIEDRRAPMVVRLLDVYPHGSAFRYDIVYYGL